MLMAIIGILGKLLGSCLAPSWIRDARLDWIRLVGGFPVTPFTPWDVPCHQACQESLCIVQVPAGGISGFKAFQGHASKSQFETPQHAKSQKMFRGLP